MKNVNLNHLIYALLILKSRIHEIGIKPLNYFNKIFISIRCHSLSFPSSHVPRFLYRHFSQNQASLKLFCSTPINVGTKELPKWRTGVKLRSVIFFQDGGPRLGFRLLRDLVKLPHPRDLVLSQVFCYSPPTGKEIQSNTSGVLPPLGLNIDWWIWRDSERFTFTWVLSCL